MTTREALLDLVARVGARDGAAVRVSETDVRQWPAEAVAALKAHRLLVRVRPATTVVCPGCEADCVMPVQTIPAGPRAAARFIVCDKRSDINRVTLTRAHMDQWKCDAEGLARTSRDPPQESHYRDPRSAVAAPPAAPAWRPGSVSHRMPANHSQ